MMKVEHPADIHLFLQEEIYRIEDKPIEEASIPTEATPRRADAPVYSQKSQNGTIVLVAQKEELTTAQSDFMGKILAAVHLKPGDTGLIEWRTNQHLSQLSQLNLRNGEKWIVFGQTFAEAGLYQKKNLEGATVLQAHTLDTLMEDQSTKARLWKALKAMYL